MPCLYILITIWIKTSEVLETSDVLLKNTGLAKNAYFCTLFENGMFAMRLFFVLIYFILLMLHGCNAGENTENKSSTPQDTTKMESRVDKSLLPTKIEIVREFPHDPGAYTQGLFYHEGYLYESTGQLGESSLRKVDFQTGEVLKKVDLEDEYFGEGICLSDGKIYMLTWRNRTGFVFDFETFELLDKFSYDTEGWGLECREKELIMTDGSEIISFLDKNTYRKTGEMKVRYHDSNLNLLNELELVDDTLFANIYMYDAIAKIDYYSGNIIDIIDCRSLRNKLSAPRAEAFNGIAYIPETETYIVTGKYWDKYFEVKFTK